MSLLSVLGGKGGLVQEDRSAKRCDEAHGRRLRVLRIPHEFRILNTCDTRPANRLGLRHAPSHLRNPEQTENSIYSMSQITPSIPAKYFESLVTSFNATDSGVRRDFLRLFPRTRESYDTGKQQEVLEELLSYCNWKRLGKPWFRQDAGTGIVYRKSPPSQSRPMGRITVCVPYEHEFDIAVRQRKFF